MDARCIAIVDGEDDRYPTAIVPSTVLVRVTLRDGSVLHVGFTEDGFLEVRGKTRLLASWGTAGKIIRIKAE
jgi:hypothetical protein